MGYYTRAAWAELDPPASGARAIDLWFRDLRVFNRGRPALSPGQPQLARDRQERDRHHRQDGELEVLLDHVDLAQEVAEQRDADRPQEAADHVERDERAVVHARDTGDDRGERAHDRDEPGQDDRLGAVLVEEGVRLLDVLLLEEARVGAAEDRRARPAPEQVADLVAGNRGHERADEQEPEREVQRLVDARRARCQEPGREQQRVAGQEEADQQPRFGEDDGEDAPETDVVDQALRVEEAPSGQHSSEHLRRLSDRAEPPPTAPRAYCGWFHSAQPVPVRPVAGSRKRHSARGNLDTRQAPSSSSTGANATGSTSRLRSS